jgi:hypothetical protein
MRANRTWAATWTSELALPELLETPLVGLIVAAWIMLAAASLLVFSVSSAERRSVSSPPRGSEREVCSSR